MADFQRFLPTLLRFEGGYFNDITGPGIMYKGITLATFQHCAERLLGIEPTLHALLALTDEQAGTIYKALHWDVVGGDHMHFQPVANIVSDFHVSSGEAATRLLQRVLNALGASITVDGRVGPVTLKALDQADQYAVYTRYKHARGEYYRELVRSRPVLARYLHGWLERVAAFPDFPAVEREREH